jgi:hypothetical protein
MNPPDSSAIQEIARPFQTKPQVRVVDLAQSLGLGVWEVDLPKNISGKIIKDGKHGGRSGYSILINANDPTVRRRFTVAHEIGHFVLHRPRIGDGLVDDAMYRSGLSTWAEVQANKAAADILMPYSLIDKAVQSGVKSLDDLAALFVVSLQAMSIRLGIPE